MVNYYGDGTTKSYVIPTSAEYQNDYGSPQSYSIWNPVTGTDSTYYYTKYTYADVYFYGGANSEKISLSKLGNVPEMQFNQRNFYIWGNDGDDHMSVSMAAAGNGISRSYVYFQGNAGTDTMQVDFSNAENIETYQSVRNGSVTSMSFTGTVFGEKGFTYLSVGIDVKTTEKMIFKGSKGDDHIYGLSDDDWLDGGLGDDTFYGSSGDDTYIFDSAGDVVYDERMDGGKDTIWTTVSVDLHNQGFIENLRLGGTADIDGMGNHLANLITGNSGSNVIAGGTGNDSLYGKGGADTFAFAEKGAANKDSIWDFGSDDRIVLDRATFSGLATAGDGSLTSDSFSINKAVGTGPQVIYNKGTGVLSYDVNGTLSGGAEDIAFVGKNLAYFDQGYVLVA